MLVYSKSAGAICFSNSYISVYFGSVDLEDNRGSRPFHVPFPRGNM